MRLFCNLFLKKKIQCDRNLKLKKKSIFKPITLYHRRRWETWNVFEATLLLSGMVPFYWMIIRQELSKGIILSSFPSQETVKYEDKATMQTQDHSHGKDILLPILLQPISNTKKVNN